LNVRFANSAVIGLRVYVSCC